MAELKADWNPVEFFEGKSYAEKDTSAGIARAIVIGLKYIGDCVKDTSISRDNDYRSK